MKILSRYIKVIIAAIVLLIGNSTFCYADILDGALRNIQIDSVQSFQTSAAPEPATMLLFGIGLVLLAAVARKGNNKLH